MATRPVSANALLDARECGSQCVRGARNPSSQFITFLPSLPSLCLSRSPIPHHSASLTLNLPSILSYPFSYSFRVWGAVTCAELQGASAETDFGAL